MMIRHTAALCLAAGLVALPGLAQESEPPEPPMPDTGNEMTEGMGLLSDGAKMLLRGLLGEIEPHMREMSEELREWNFQGLTIEDLDDYHPPEVLPNGDIVIRRKVPLQVDPPGLKPGEEVEL